MIIYYWYYSRNSYTICRSKDGNEHFQLPMLNAEPFVSKSKFHLFSNEGEFRITTEQSDYYLSCIYPTSFGVDFIFRFCRVPSILSSSINFSNFIEIFSEGIRILFEE